MSVATQATLTTDLRALGLAEGQVLIVHSSLKSLGYVLGGAQAVVGALIAVNRAPMRHYAESRTKGRRVKIRLVPLGPPEQRTWVEAPDVADDLGVHFPAIGEAFLSQDLYRTGKIARSGAILAPGRQFVDFAADYFQKALGLRHLTQPRAIHRSFC